MADFRPPPGRRLRPGGKDGVGLEFAQAPLDGRPRNPGRPFDHANAAVPQRARFARRPQPTRALGEHRRQRGMFGAERGQPHASRYQASGSRTSDINQLFPDTPLGRREAGHVTGGRVFGYDNVRTERGHVERTINEPEAAVVRKVFELCAKGHGRISIAKLLNAKGAPAPRSQQDRPRAWAPTSVREVLYRELYRGVQVWAKTKKRNAWGQVKPSKRPDHGFGSRAECSTA